MKRNHAHEIRYDFSDISLIQIRRDLIILHISQIFQRKSAILGSISKRITYNNATEKLAMDWNLAQRMVGKPDPLFDRTAKTKQLVSRVRPTTLNANFEQSASDSPCVLRNEVEVGEKRGFVRLPLTDISLKQNKCFSKVIIELCLRADAAALSSHFF